MTAPVAAGWLLRGRATIGQGRRRPGSKWWPEAKTVWSVPGKQATRPFSRSGLPGMWSPERGLSLVLQAENTRVKKPVDSRC